MRAGTYNKRGWSDDDSSCGHSRPPFYTTHRYRGRRPGHCFLSIRCDTCLVVVLLLLLALVRVPAWSDRRPSCPIRSLWPKLLTDCPPCQKYFPRCFTTTKTSPCLALLPCVAQLSSVAPPILPSSTASATAWEQSAARPRSASLPMARPRCRFVRCLDPTRFLSLRMLTVCRHVGARQGCLHRAEWKPKVSPAGRRRYALASMADQTGSTTPSWSC